MATFELLWNPPPPHTEIAESEVHVWSVDLDVPSSRTSELFEMLSADEQHRADKFKFNDGRARYIAGRSTLRRLLGRVLKLDPSALVFRYTERGKPELDGATAGQLHFNISHSDGLALIALTRSQNVGVDVESVRAVNYGEDIAARFFSNRESAGLAALPVAERPAAFFNLWTRKEAWLKATGDGIAESLKRVEVSFLPGEPARVLNIADAPDEAARWTLVDLKPADGFTGTLAIPAHDLNVRRWRWVE